MRRVFLAGGALGLAIVVAVPIAGGLSYKKETSYVESDRVSAPFTAVYIQSSPTGTGWGNPDFLGFSAYGPPFDLLITGTLPDGESASSLELTNLTVETDGAAVMSRPRALIPIENVIVLKGGNRSPARRFTFVSPRVTSDTPTRIRVSGTVKSASSSAPQGSFFAHVFEVRRTRVLALGRWTWNL